MGKRKRNILQSDEEDDSDDEDIGYRRHRPSAARAIREDDDSDVENLGDKVEYGDSDGTSLLYLS